MEKILLTMMGRSIWGLFNSLWADIRSHDYLPDRVYIMTAGCEIGAAEQAADMIRVLLRESGSRGEVLVITVVGDDIREIKETVLNIVTEEKDKGNEVAVDVTPGTKAVVVGTLTALPRDKVDHLFYLYISSMKNAARPFLEIPLQYQHRHDYLKEAAK